jgi:hypothetical protein
MPRESGARCGHCHGTALFAVTREGTPGVPQMLMHACRSHLALASEKVAEALHAGSVTVYLLNAKSGAIGGGIGTEEILEQVRRLGAHSAAQPHVAHQMEDALHLAVLVMIAHGAQGPSELASAALVSRRYHFERQY